MPAAIRWWLETESTNRVDLRMDSSTSRRAFLERTGLGALALSLARCTSDAPGSSQSGTRSGQTPDRPNILLVTTDYQSGMDVPAIGHRFLDMPILDRLSREGAVFRRHYSTAPICIPARNTWITGQYPHTHGKWENIGGWVPETSPVLMAELGAHGYQTIAVGKLHLGFPDDEPLGGFDRWVSADRKGNFGAAGQQDDYAAFLAERGLVRDDYLRMGVEAPTPHVYDWPWDESWHIDHYVGARALEIVARGELREPWFLWVSFNGPHNPWDPPARCSAPYKEMELPLGHTFPGELDTKPTDHTRLRFNYTGDIPRLIDSDYRRRDGFSAHVDLMPTILSLSGAPLPEAMEGRDLTALLTNSEASVQDEVFIEVRGNVSIVTDRWKLGLYPHDGEGDLYDLDDDPFELINRFEDGDYADVREELSERIREFSPEWPPAFSVVGR